MYQNSGEEAPAQQAEKKFEFSNEVAKEAHAGGPRRYYDDGELDIASARVADEHGNLVLQDKT